MNRKLIEIFSKLKILPFSILHLASLVSCHKSGNLVFLEAENFREPGGWVIDQQAIDVMGSSYLLAHGLGIPVNDAHTTINLPCEGIYRVWVRTRDWVAPWGVEGAPGRIQR